MGLSESTRRAGSCCVQDDQGPRLPLVYTRPKAGADGLGTITALTWNIAAVNNNPFEYWIQYDDPYYINLMTGVEQFLSDPGIHDVEVSKIFTDAMYSELVELMKAENIPGLDIVERDAWRGGDLRLSHRKVVSEFMTDKSLGAKRLISMPDRCTNSINVVTKRETSYRPPPICRPTVINNYEGDLSQMDIWWDSWKIFMFQTKMSIRTKSGIKVQRPIEMLEQIPRSKYPAVTEFEETHAKPIQLIALAIFDAVWIHTMNRLSPDGTWQQIKARICDKLFRHKHDRTVEILAGRYESVDIICLQEAAAIFTDRFRGSALSDSHALVVPETMDGKRDQNSFVLLRKSRFRQDSIKEVTNAVPTLNPQTLQVAPGDLLVVEALTMSAKPFLIVSFHGDTAGKLTLPLIEAVHQAKASYPEHTFIMGLDANCYEVASDDKTSFDDFVRESKKMGFTSCFGSDPDVTQCRTTCSARTFVQPQLNKAVRYASRVKKSDCNPKDTLLFYTEQLAIIPAGTSELSNPLKDNTGNLEYKEDTIFPTLDFPSDHGIVTVSLKKL